MRDEGFKIVLHPDALKDIPPEKHAAIMAEIAQFMTPAGAAKLERDMRLIKPLRVDHKCTFCGVALRNCTEWRDEWFCDTTSCEAFEHVVFLDDDSTLAIPDDPGDDYWRISD